MDNKSIKFYTNRLKTGVLGVMSLGMAYLAYVKLLADPYGLTEIATIVIWGTFILLILIGIYSIIKTVDPRPVVEIMPEGLLVRKHIFFEKRILWEDIAGFEHEQYTNRHANMAGVVKVTTHVLKIYQPNKRPISINLTLLNQQGNKFSEALSRYIAS